MKPYALCADIHLHQWSAFAATDPDGMNTRLKALLDELRRMSVELRAAGGNRIVIAGDLFHVRGQIAPQVLNPVVDLFADLIRAGFQIIIVAGNHDLATKDWSKLGSGVTALEKIGCEIAEDEWEVAGHDEEQHLAMLSWHDKVEDLKTALGRLKDTYTAAARKTIDLILHAPINGVIKGLPDTGLDPDYLASLGFRRVFAGHYHNHVEFADGRVYSIGALAHHTWSDVGSKAGFMLVYEDRIEQFPSQLPQFIDADAGMTIEQIAQAAKGNYIRAKLNTSKASDIEKMREFLTKSGARGVTIVSVTKPTEERDATVAAAVAAGASLEQSISEFVKTLKHPHEAAIQLEAAKVLASVVEEV